MASANQTEAMSPRKRERLPDLTTYRGRLAERIYTRRIAVGLSAAELGDMLGVTRNTIHAWECGEKALDWERLPALAKALKVTPGRLVPPE